MPWLLGVVVVGVADRHLLHTGAEVSRGTYVLTEDVTEAGSS